MFSSVSDPMLPRPFRIVAVRSETADAFTLKLAPGIGGESCTFSPGQFNMLYVFGAGEVPISISGDPADTSALIHTVRAVGAVTRAMQKCKRGESIGVRGPFGKCWPLENAVGKDVIVCAGGLGLAPVRPILYRLAAERARFGAVTLLYGARSPDELLFRRELETWRGRFDFDIEVAVNHAGPAWRGNVGWITALIPRARFDPANVCAFVCGPEIMMRSTANDLAARGVPEERISISMERNMKCAVGFCGHCMFGPNFICKDGPVFPYNRVKDLMLIREL